MTTSPTALTECTPHSPAIHSSHLALLSTHSTSYKNQSSSYVHVQYIPKSQQTYPYIFLRFTMIERSRPLPRKRFAMLSKVSFVIQTLIQRIEQTSIENLIETLQILKILLKNHSIRLIETFRHLHHYRTLLQLPKLLKYTIRNHHHNGFFLLLGHRERLVRSLMHVLQHLQG